MQGKVFKSYYMFFNIIFNTFVIYKKLLTLITLFTANYFP